MNKQKEALLRDLVLYDYSHAQSLGIIFEAGFISTSDELNKVFKEIHDTYYEWYLKWCRTHPESIKTS